MSSSHVHRFGPRRSWWALCAILALVAGIVGSAQVPAAPLLVVANGVSVISFGSESIGVAAPPMAVVIQNAGNANLTVSTAAVTGLHRGDFLIASNGCSTVAPGGSCAITVQFRPTAVGERSARLSISDNSSGSPQLVPLVGTGVDPTVPQKIVGPVDPRHGFPISVTDQNGLTLGLCYDTPGLCLTTLPDPTQPPLVSDTASNFPDESFWFVADASIEPWPLGQRAILVIGQEAAFTTAAVVPGGQAMFGRIRIRIDGLIPNTTYRITHPYGRDLLAADDAGVIFATEDIGCLVAPCDYNLIKTSRVWPFLKWDPSVLPAPPAGFIGDPAVPHRVIGSPINQNVFRVEQVSGNNFQLLGETDLFTISGKIVASPPPPPPPTVTVPDVLTLLQADAQTLLTAAGLTVGAITTQVNALPAGRVVSQNPVAGASVVAGSAVALVVSLGPPNVTVPNVVNQTQATAASLLTAAQLTVGAITNANSATVPAGRVISQNPAAGVSIAAGSAVALVISLGPANVAVPNVVNQTQAAATTAITAAGLVVGAITNANSATVPAGSVISQNPAAGASVAPGSAVALVISLGPANVTVPNVVNLTQAAATTAITGAGLAVGAITTANSATVAAGRVISQSPVSGASVAPGSAVALVISLGPANVTVPNVVNLTQGAATTAITGAGLAVGAITNANSATVPAGSVISQNPAAGSSVAAGSAVALVISLGPAAAIVPNVVNLTQAAATTAITGAGLAVGAITNANSATVPAGSVISQNPAAGTGVAAGSAVALVVSLGPAPSGPTVHASVTSAANVRGNRTVQITTTVPTRLVAFVSADGPQATGTAGQSATVSGAGLTWTLVTRANGQWGNAEIWTANAPAALANASITSTLLRHRAAPDYIHMVRLVAFTGVSAIGASNAASGQTTSTATISITAQTGSVVYAVGEDWSNALTRTFPAGQVQDVQQLGADGDTFWVQRSAAALAATGTVTFTATTAAQAAPGDRWNFAIVELKP